MYSTYIVSVCCVGGVYTIVSQMSDSIATEHISVIWKLQERDQGLQQPHLVVARVLQIGIPQEVVAAHLVDSFAEYPQSGQDHCVPVATMVVGRSVQGDAGHLERWSSSSIIFPHCLYRMMT